jgi:fluoride exporter
MTVLLVALGAAVGAPLRYLTDRLIQARAGSAFPWGTLTVNVAGSLVLGFVLGIPADPALIALIGTGFCGALTTYSTFAYETLQLPRLRALANVVVSILAGLAAAYLGLALAQGVTG